MEGKFTLKFDSKESFEKGSVDFMKLLNAWKENATKYERNYELIANSEGDWHLEVNLQVTKRED